MRRIIVFLLLFRAAQPTQAQSSPTGAALPTPEQFLNAVYLTVVDSTFDHYYLVAGTDSCRFLKYDYDDWLKYHLKEPLTINVMNELSGKVYLSRYPYFWKQGNLEKALCITRKQADSLLDKKHPVYSFSLPQFTDDGQYAVIDLNFICGSLCGRGITAIFRLTGAGEWKLVGQSTNWSSF